MKNVWLKETLVSGRVACNNCQFLSYEANIFANREI